MIKTWWLLALGGLLDAAYSLTNLVMEGPDGSLTLRTFAPLHTVKTMCMLAAAAGVCTVAAGLWDFRKHKSWLLVLNGLALSAFGFIALLPSFMEKPHSFLPFALLIVVMALSIGIFALANALELRRHVRDKWFLSLAGAASVVFALGFLALGFRWIRLEPGPFNLWMSSYFGFSALCMLGLARWAGTRH